MITPDDALSAAEEMAEVFDTLGVRYLLGGSMAAAVWSEPRFTRDVDMVAALEPQHVPPLLAALGDRWYADEWTIREAISRRSSFNVIRMVRMVKVDVFVPPDEGLHAAKWSRARAVRLSQTSKRPLSVTSAEDMLLQKLSWYRDGDGVSQQQWLDVVALIRTLGADLDELYVRRWAEQLGLVSLLERARGEAEG